MDFGLFHKINTFDELSKIKVLSKIDVLYLLDIYPAGEKTLKNINSKNIVKKLKLKNKNTYYLDKKENIRLVLQPYFSENNTIVFMGAGSITNIAHSLFDK